MQNKPLDSKSVPREKAGNVNQITFSDLYICTLPSLRSFAARYVGPDEAEDIVQSAVLSVLCHKENIPVEVPLDAYLYKAVRNKCLNYLERNKVKERIYQYIIHDYLNGSGYDIIPYEAMELSGIYDKILAGLPREMVATYRMSRVERLTHREIAHSLGVSPQLVNYRISKVMGALKTATEKYLDI